LRLAEFGNHPVKTALPFVAILTIDSHARTVPRGTDIRMSPIGQPHEAGWAGGIFKDVQWGTAVACQRSYTQSMQTYYMKAALAGFWILGVGLLGYAVGATSLVGWTVLAALALTPPVAIMRLWRTPSQSMSESIREALR
jgi:hypothetical protein